MTELADKQRLNSHLYYWVVTIIPYKMNKKSYKITLRFIKQPSWKYHSFLDKTFYRVDFLEKHCYDENGKMYFIVDKKGAPIRMWRYVFSESFAAIAYAAYYKAPVIEKYVERATEAFAIFLKYNTTPGMIPPKFSTKRQMRGMGGPMIGIAMAQELRKNLNDDSYTVQISN